MSASTGPVVFRNAATSGFLPRPDTPPAALLRRPPAPRRTKIWEFNNNLHCSMIGTCLSTAELRKLLTKLGLATSDASDHDLHGVAVTLAGRHDDAGRQLHKTLDQRHRLAVNQFSKAETSDALRALWREALKRGDIPGAYWATLTHPQANQAIIREAFGDVHMLSHLIGSANRADIQRLCALETEKAALQDRLQRQQQALHDAIVGRDAQIAALRQALADHLVADRQPNANAASSADALALRDLVADRERRLAAERRRRSGMEERLIAVQAERDAERARRAVAEEEVLALRRELAVIEGSLAASDEAGPALRLDGLALLYVGGRPNQIARIRLLVEASDGIFLHHDGGMENHQTLLPGLVSRAALVVFPVDCISHDAANIVKSLCRKAGKRFVPLRSASMTSVLAALRTTRPEMVG